MTVQALKRYPFSEMNKNFLEKFFEFKHVQTWDDMMKHLDEDWEVLMELEKYQFIMMRLLKQE